MKPNLTPNEHATLVELIDDRLLQLAAFNTLLRTTDDEKRAYAMEARTLADIRSWLVSE